MPTSLRTAFEAGRGAWRRLRANPPPVADGIGYRLEAETEERERVLVSFLGPEEPNQMAQIEAAARAVEGDGRWPVIVASDLPIHLLVASARPVELLPTRSQLGILSGPEYEAYLRRRWVILRAKWRIRRDLVLGQRFDAFLARELGPEATGEEPGQP